MIRTLLAVVVLGAPGCAVSTAPAPVSEPAAQVPVVARWRVSSDAGGELRVTGVVTRWAALPFALQVRAELPAGLELVSGESAATLAAGSPPGETVLNLVLRYAAVPKGDLLLVADGAGVSMGVHAVDAYRFGRPAPVAPLPERSGASGRVGTLDLGPGVRLGKQGR